MDCGICSEKLETEETKLNCGHYFHSKCIFWIVEDRTCIMGPVQEEEQRISDDESFGINIETETIEKKQIIWLF